LNSKLNREVAEFEATTAEGTHHLSDLRDTYQPSSNEEAEALVHVLGGTSFQGNINDTIEDKRKRALEAATARLKNEEEELERSCGTQKQSGS